MPTLAWRATVRVDASHEYVVMATSFTVTSTVRSPAILSATQDLWGMFAATSGLVGYSLRANPLRRTLASLSAWVN